MTDAKEDRIKKGKGEMMGNADTEKTQNTKKRNKELEKLNN